MAFDAAQKAVLVEITLLPKADVNAAVESLNSEEESLISDDIDKWEAIRDSHVRLTGDVDFDNERKRQAIRTRIMAQLGLVSSVRPTFFTLASAGRGR